MPSDRTPIYRYENFEFLDLNASYQGEIYCVTGKLRNLGGQLSYLAIVAVLYDDYDNLINLGQYNVPDPEEAVGNQTVAFEVCTDPFAQAVAGYVLEAQGG
jgi:hypothetical protein